MLPRHAVELSNDENPGTEMTITATVIIEDLHQFSTLDLQI